MFLNNKVSIFIQSFDKKNQKNLVLDLEKEKEKSKERDLERAKKRRCLPGCDASDNIRVGLSS